MQYKNYAVIWKTPNTCKPKGYLEWEEMSKIFRDWYLTAQLIDNPYLGLYWWKELAPES